jgi:hypothetical protein
MPPLFVRATPAPICDAPAAQLSSFQLAHQYQKMQESVGTPPEVLRELAVPLSLQRHGRRRLLRLPSRRFDVDSPRPQRLHLRRCGELYLRMLIPYFRSGYTCCL